MLSLAAIELEAVVQDCGQHVIKAASEERAPNGSSTSSLLGVPCFRLAWLDMKRARLPDTSVTVQQTTRTCRDVR